MSKSKIEWTDRTWNPTIGCARMSEGCRNCYAERMAHRHASNPGTPAYHGLTKDGRWTGEVRLLPGRLGQPKRWRKPSMIFVDSMSDLFQHTIHDDYIVKVFEVMAETPRHTYQILTKRPARMQRFLSAHYPEPLPNVWLGVSVEDQETANKRVPLLLATPAAVRWISLEPMLGPVDLRPWLGRGLLTPGVRSRRWLNWVVLGGESGPGARPMHPQWARDVRDQCKRAGVPFMFKQWGEWVTYRQQAPGALGGKTERKPGWMLDCPDDFYRVGKRKAGRMLDGELHDGYPK